MPYADVTKRRIHTAWKNMIWRCYNEKHSSYKYYGGRGIKVCKEWQKFKPFYVWTIENGYSNDLTIDRIDNNGNYEPSNCRWMTSKDQANNRRTNHLITFNGETKTISEWADSLDITHQALVDRLKSKHWTFEESLTIKKNGRPVKQISFRKQVYQKSVNNELVKKWDSISEAAEVLKIHNENISRALSNPRYTAGGYLWQYA